MPFGNLAPGTGLAPGGGGFWAKNARGTYAPAWEWSDMKSRDNLVRLKQFQVNDKKRQLAQLDTMIAEFDRMAGELEVQIGAEERKAGITDINHFAYPTFAKAARQRRDNLKNSQADLMSRREDAQALLDEAEAELSKAEAIESRGVRDVAEAPRLMAG